MAKPMKRPKYLQGKNPKLLIEVFEDYKPMEDEHTDTCGEEGEIEASEVED